MSKSLARSEANGDHTSSAAGQVADPTSGRNTLPGKIAAFRSQIKFAYCHQGGDNELCWHIKVGSTAAMQQAALHGRQQAHASTSGEHLKDFEGHFGFSPFANASKELWYLKILLSADFRCPPYWTGVATSRSS